MTDQGPDAEPGPPEAEVPSGMPRWVKAAAIVLGLLLLLLLVLQLTGIAGDHGPGMHDSSGVDPASGRTASPTVAW